MRGLLPLLGALVLPFCAARAAEPARLALVLGNAAYAGLPALPACGPSVAAVASALRRAGFTVTERQNLTNGQMSAAIGTFGDALTAAPGSTAVAYVCGYAAEYEGRVFLVPASARLDRASAILTEGLVARLLSRAMAGTGLRAGLVLLDTAALPGKGAPPPVGQVFTGLEPEIGMASAHSLALPSGTAAPVADAASAALADPDADTRGLVQAIQSRLGGGNPGLAVSVDLPERPAPLAPPAPAPAAPPSPAPPPPALPERAAAPAGPAVLSQADLRQVQAALSRLGYYTGRPDGLPGPETLAAIRRFQHELGADMTGRLTAEQAARLLGPAR